MEMRPQGTGGRVAWVCVKTPNSGRSRVPATYSSRRMAMWSAMDFPPGWPTDHSSATRRYGAASEGSQQLVADVVPDTVPQRITPSHHLALIGADGRQSWWLNRFDARRLGAVEFTRFRGR